MVVITGQVATAAIGTDAFQECDTTGITQLGHQAQLPGHRAEDIPRVIREAFHIATTGRPGPVLVDIPKDIVDPKNPTSAHGVVLARDGRPARLQPAPRG